MRSFIRLVVCAVVCLSGTAISAQEIPRLPAGVSLRESRFDAGPTTSGIMAPRAALSIYKELLALPVDHPQAGVAKGLLQAIGPADVAKLEKLIETSEEGPSDAPELRRMAYLLEPLGEDSTIPFADRLSRAAERERSRLGALSQLREASRSWGHRVEDDSVLEAASREAADMALRGRYYLPDDVGAVYETDRAIQEAADRGRRRWSLRSPHRQAREIAAKAAARSATESIARAGQVQSLFHRIADDARRIIEKNFPDREDADRRKGLWDDAERILAQALLGRDNIPREAADVMKSLARDYEELRDQDDLADYVRAYTRSASEGKAESDEMIAAKGKENVRRFLGLIERLGEKDQSRGAETDNGMKAFKGLFSSVAAEARPFMTGEAFGENGGAQGRDLKERAAAFWRHAEIDLDESISRRDASLRKEFIQALRFQLQMYERFLRQRNMPDRAAKIERSQDLLRRAQDLLKPEETAAPAHGRPVPPTEAEIAGLKALVREFFGVMRRSLARLEGNDAAFRDAAFEIWEKAEVIMGLMLSEGDRFLSKECVGLFERSIEIYQGIFDKADTAARSSYAAEIGVFGRDIVAAAHKVFENDRQEQRRKAEKLLRSARRMVKDSGVSGPDVSPR